MVYDFYKEDRTRRSERTGRRRPRTSHAPPVTKIVCDIGDGNIATDVSIITMTPSSPSVTRVSMIQTTRELTTRVTRSSISISSQNIRYTRNLISQRRGSKRAKI